MARKGKPRDQISKTYATPYAVPMTRCRNTRLPAVLVLALALAGCGTPWNHPYPAAEHGENILYGAFSERPKHLDPAVAYSSDEYRFISQIYEPPLQYHYLERPYRLVPRAAAAMPRIRLVDAAGNPLPEGADPARVAFSIYEVTIRPGIRFAPHPAFARGPDGAWLHHDLGTARVRALRRPGDLAPAATRELTAADYVYQVKRLADKRLQSPIAGLLQGYIHGMKDFAERLARRVEAGTDRDRFVDLREVPHDGLEVVDRHTFRIVLEGRYPQFVYWLAMPFFSPMPWEADRFYRQPGLAERNIVLDWYPVGTGPYMLTENNPNRRMVLERNPEFRGEPYPEHGEPGDREAGLLADAGRAMPFIDRAVYVLEKENIPYWNKFLQGYYDASSITSDNFDQAVQLSAQGDPKVTPAFRERGIGLESAVTTSIIYRGFNMLDPVVGGYDERARLLRRAISIAVDTGEYVTIFANGRGITAQGPLPPAIFGHVEGRAGMNPYVFHWVDGAPRRRPLEEARRLLAEAGYPGGVSRDTGEPLVLHYDVRATGPDDKARLDWMRKQLAKLGIQLDIRATDYNRFRDKMRKGTAQIFRWGWNADYPDPENFLFLLYGPNGKAEHGGENAANYANPEFDRLFERMRNMENGPERAAIIRRMVDIARRDAPWIWGFHPKELTLHHQWYHNAKPHMMANNTLKYLRIDPRLREAKRREWNAPVLWPLAAAAGVLVLVTAPAVAAWRRRERERALA